MVPPSAHPFTVPDTRPILANERKAQKAKRGLMLHQIVPCHDRDGHTIKSIAFTSAMKSSIMISGIVVSRSDDHRNIMIAEWKRF